MGLLFSELKKWEPSLSVVWSKKDRFSVSSLGRINAVEGLQENYLYFVKDDRYAGLLKNQLEGQKFTNLGVILEKKFVEKLSPTPTKDEGFWEQILGGVSYVAQVDGLPLAISALSRPFYEKMMASFNDVVDGRQMGTAQIHPTAHISQNVFIGANVKIGPDVRLYPGAVILSDSEIERECEIFPNVTVYQRVKIGKRVRVHAGAVIGSDGFGYNFSAGIHHKIWHLGSVKVEDDVEIGPCSCIDRGTFGDTVIGQGSKIDNQVHIGHNSLIEKGVILCGQVGTGGSSKVGAFTVMGGKSGVADNTTVGKECQLAGGALATSSFGDKNVLGGHPARPLNEWLRGIAYLRKESLKKRSAHVDKKK